nr:2OG-Fe(II) oxygenase [Actinomycetota bacterium]
MSVVAGSAVTGPGFFLDRKQLRALALERRDGYRDARPYPHAVFDDFLGKPLALALAEGFP